MSDDEPAETAPIAEVEITVAGHTIIVKAAESLSEVAAQALGLYEQTRLPAKQIPFGFATMASETELRPQPDLRYRLTEADGPEED